MAAQIDGHTPQTRHILLRLEPDPYRPGMRASTPRIKGFRTDCPAWDRFIECDRHSDRDRLCRAVTADPEAGRVFLNVIAAHNEASGGALFV